MQLRWLLLVTSPALFAFPVHRRVRGLQSLYLLAPAWKASMRSVNGPSSWRRCWTFSAQRETCGTTTSERTPSNKRRLQRKTQKIRKGTFHIPQLPRELVAIYLCVLVEAARLSSFVFTSPPGY